MHIGSGITLKRWRSRQSPVHWLSAAETPRRRKRRTTDPITRCCRLASSSASRRLSQLRQVTHAPVEPVRPRVTKHGGERTAGGEGWREGAHPLNPRARSRFLRRERTAAIFARSSRSPCHEFHACEILWFFIRLKTPTRRLRSRHASSHAFQAMLICAVQGGEQRDEAQAGCRVQGAGCRVQRRL